LIMGQAHSQPGATFYAFGGPQSSPPLKFSSRHGDNCQILRDGSQAKRAESFCKGIVFSDRPVEAGERVCIRLTELSIRWSGVLRLGFCAQDPMTIQSLPKYACPDLTGKPGFWAKALAEKYAESNALIHFYFTSSGDVHYGVNGVDKGIFFSGLDTRSPLWCMMDLYGNCTSIEMVDMRRSLNNFVEMDPETVSEDSQGDGEAEDVTGNIDTVENVSNTLNNLTVAEEDEDEDELEADNDEADLLANLPPLRYHRDLPFSSRSLHPTSGLNVRLDRGRRLAWRLEDEYSNGYVFTARPVTVGERIVIQIIETENMYIGSLAFGLTSCDPSSIEVSSLPEDADMLLDRPEYWVVSKDVASSPETGDELSFGVNGDGSVEFSRNGQGGRVVMWVDTSVPLWMFWDVYGNTQKLRLVGATQARLEDAEAASEASQENDRNTLALTDIADTRHLERPEPPPRSRSTHTIGRGQPASSDQASGSSRQPESSRSEECKICYEATVDCVLYVCGHMCLCYQCALQQWKGRGGGICPMCREPIQDVIKIYRS